MDKKPFLVDVPVKINIWIRPDFQKKQWEIIRQARPSVIFLQSDGGRTESEKRIICENRKMIEDTIDWECTLFKLYEDNNLGLYKMAAKTREFIWSKVDRCIFMEDDQIVSVSFFNFCAELLEKYKDDERIECICGTNLLNEYEDASSDYFFSRQGSIWGVATWRRVYKTRGIFDYYQDNYTMNLLKERTRKNKTIWKRLNAYGKSRIYENHVAGSEFWIEFDMYAQNRLQIIPKYNLVSNIGCDEKATHIDSYKKLSKKMRKVFYKPVFEYAFPLKHPLYVIPDVKYEKLRNKCISYNTPVFFVLMKRIRNFFKHLIKLDIKYFSERIKKKKIEEEK